MRVLIVGATGFIGKRLAGELIGRGENVLCMVRDPESAAARELQQGGCEIRRGDLTDHDSLDAAVAGIDAVYHLAHLMSAEGEGDLVQAETAAASALASAATAAGVRRVIYLGGLGDHEASKHLLARQRTAEVLRRHGPPLTYFRAAMVVGGESGSYVLLRSLVERLPALPAPDWLGNRTQPIGAAAVVTFLADALLIPESEGREIELGGPEVMTYAEMLDGMAASLGTGGPCMMPAPAGISAQAAGRVAGTVTRGEPRVAEQITAGLATDTVVGDSSGMALFEIEPESYRLSLARAFEEDLRVEEAGQSETAGSR